MRNNLIDVDAKSEETGWPLRYTVENIRPALTLN